MKIRTYGRRNNLINAKLVGSTTRAVIEFDVAGKKKLIGKNLVSICPSKSNGDSTQRILN